MTESFINRFRQSLVQQTLVRLILGKYRGREPGLTKVIIRLIMLREQPCLSFVYRYQTRDVTQNLPVEEGIGTIRGLLGTDFRSAHLFTSEDTVQLEFTKKGKCRESIGPAVGSSASLTDLEHDHAKERLIDPARPFLQALGITHGMHQVLPSMSRKWKQINVFLELFRGALMASRIDRSKPVGVVDFGSGKGYLTFAVYDYLRNTLGVEAAVTGIEWREDLVRFCREVAVKSGMEGLAFHQGDVASYAPGAIQVLIALHACDTATDQAIDTGIRAGAEIIMCAPCCHKEIRPLMQIPPVLKPVLRYGVHLGQEAEMVTDSLRALRLEASGYETQVFEFVSLEHTGKNKMILGVKRVLPVDPGPFLAEIASLKAFYGIKTK